MLIAFLLLIAGLFLLIAGGEGTVRGGSALAARFHISPYVIGATIIALGTSAPELAATVTAALKGAPSLALGNVVGSNIANLGLILGLAATLRTLTTRADYFRFEVPVILLVLVAMVVFGWNGTIGRVEGILLLLGAAWAIRRTLVGAKLHRRSAAEDDQLPAYGASKSILLVLLGLASLYFGGQLLVEGALRVVRAAGISEWAIGAVIVALGTSMPEVFTSVVAALRGKTDLAIGNVLGSNTFNVLFVLGTGASISPISTGVDIHLDLLLFSAMTLLITFLLSRGFPLKRGVGLPLLCAYLGYITATMFFG